MQIKYYHDSKGLNIASGDQHSPSLFCITGIPEDQLTALRNDLNRHFPVAREETWMPDDVEYREIDPKLADSGDVASFDYTPDLTRSSTWVVGSLTVAPVSPRSLVIRPGDYVKGVLNDSGIATIVTVGGGSANGVSNLKVYRRVNKTDERRWWMRDDRVYTEVPLSEARHGDVCEFTTSSVSYVRTPKEKLSDYCGPFFCAIYGRDGRFSTAGCMIDNGQYVADGHPVFPGCFLIYDGREAEWVKSIHVYRPEQAEPTEPGLYVSGDTYMIHRTDGLWKVLGDDFQCNDDSVRWDDLGSGVKVDGAHPVTHLMTDEEYTEMLDESGDWDD